MATDLISSLALGDDIHIFATVGGTCATAASTAAKVATVSGDFSLTSGMRVVIKFAYANTASKPTLNVNATGAKAIFFRGAALTSSLYYWAAGSFVEFIYDGTQWQMMGAPNNTNTTYSAATASTLGLVKVSSVNSTAVTVNSESTTAGRYYPVEMNSDNKLIVNVPWTDTNTNTDTKVTQTVCTTDDSFPVLLRGTAAGTTTTTTTTSFGTTITANPSTGVLTASGGYAGPTITSSNTSYTTLMVRGQSLNTAETTPAYNGAIAWVYE